MMAKLWRTCCRTILCLVLIFGFLPQNTQSFGGFPTREVIIRWADVLRDSLIVHLDKYTGIRNLEKTYDDLRKAKLVKLDGIGLVKRMAVDLTRNLEKKMAALERLVEAAEETVKNYKNDPTLKIKDVTFYKMTEFRDDDPSLVYSERLRKNVNYSYSGVHIPVGIYEGYPEILNGLKWSAALDKVFKENLKNNPDLMWQNFGSTAGFMRTYPAKQWSVMSRKPDFPDLYDVRLRPWYVHASSSPKDMLILMDTSGSMHGQTMEIMKIAVKTLLTTLGEDDFVNVANFSKTAQWITCFNTFVQANRRNKQVLSEAISNLTDRDMATLSNGLEFAFKQFERFEANKSDTWAGAECHKVIMLFSDGGTEEAWDVIKKYNFDKKIRIFAYVVGPHPVPYAALKEIACKNRGFFTEIPAMGGIRSNIQDYVKVLSRPIVLSGEKKFQWTNFYLDEMGLGMMTTVTLPVFNKTVDGNQSMVGVMGIDIPLREMWDAEPSYEIGPASYSFGINLNGFVVFHQDLNTAFEYSDEAPLLDFLELEIHHKAKEKLRESMINMETGKISITSLVKMPDDRHIVRHRMEYYYTPLNKTSFAISIVMPNDRTHNLVVDGMEINDGLGIDPDDGVDEVFLAPWKYCHNTDMSANVSEAIKNISYTLRTKPELCKMALIQRLLWDIRKTEDIAHYWETEDRDDKREGVVATFVQTEGGLTRIYPARAAHHLAMEVNPYRSNIFQRAFYAEDYVFLVPKVGFDSANNESHEGVTTVVKSISFARTGVTYKPAVVGVSLNPLWLQDILFSTPSASGKVPVSCSKIDDIICYLIDDGAFIISTNQPDHYEVIGKFLGYIDSEVMTVLYDKGTFERNEEFNHDDHCKKPQEVSAGFRNPIWPFYTILSSFNFGWLFDMTLWSQIYYWMYSLLGLAVVPNADALPEFFELPNETRCTTHKAQYYLGRWGRSLSGDVHCGNCTRQYSLAKVDQTNLLLLVTTPPCSPIFCDPVDPLLQEPEPDISPDICNRPLRYRRRSEMCYADNPDHGDPPSEFTTPYQVLTSKHPSKEALHSLRLNVNPIEENGMAKLPGTFCN